MADHPTDPQAAAREALALADDAERPSVPVSMEAGDVQALARAYLSMHAAVQELFDANAAWNACYGRELYATHAERRDAAARYHAAETTLRATVTRLRAAAEGGGA